MEITVPVRSVQKALDLLDLVVQADLGQGDATLSALARRLALPPNSAHNLLKSLAACGYVEQRGRGVYAPGPKCRQLGRMNRLAAPAAREAVLARLRQFAAREGEACVLAVLVNGERVVAGYVEGNQAVRVSQATVEDTPFFAKPTGRMLAAIAAEEELRQILARQGLPGANWSGITREPALRRELAALLKQGWCRVDSPGDGLIALACPVFGADGRAWGVVGTFAPAYRCRPPRTARLLKSLRRVAADLSRMELQEES